MPPTLPPLANPFKQQLQARAPQIGCWVSMADSYLAEVTATAGFDWLLIDGEHSPNDIRSTLAQLQALAAYGSHPVVRTVDHDTARIKQMLDLGAQTLLVPMVDTAEQARGIVSAMRYPPVGQRGVGAAIARASRWGLQTDYVHQADDTLCLLVQAETATALDNLDDICAVDGVDGVFIGPADLSASMGHRGNPTHPDVQRAIEDAMRRIVASGKAAGTLTSDQTLAQHYLDLGCTFVAVGLDVSLYARAVRELAARWER